MMNVREVAAYLNIKERKVYDLVRQGRIPCSRATGKWLFPQELIDRWVADSVVHPGGGGGPAVEAPRSAPPVVAGSHDPLLEWALRESDCGLALMAGGSLEGLRRLHAGEALVCGMHVLEPDGGYNRATVATEAAGRGVVLIEWAWRTQGLVLAPGNPRRIGTIADLARDGRERPRVVLREAAAGTSVLLEHLLAQAAVPPDAIQTVPDVARSQTDVGLAVLEDRADAGLAVESVARQLRLEFLPLHRERYDLGLYRRDYFEPPLQALLAFCRGERFRARARDMGGYDVSGLGAVRFNGP